MGSSAPSGHTASRDLSTDPSQPSGRVVIAVAGVVFAAAVALRLPSCYESFWLDELHSAWIVWGGFGDVAARACDGHQSPFYFWALWIWKQAVGDSEFALRMSSVLAVALSGAVATIAAARWTQSVASGAAAGMVMAVESNSLFFGTELRPYAWVIFFSLLAAVCFLALMPKNSRQESPGLWAALVSAILLATLSQPTAIGVLAWLPLVLLVRWFILDRREWMRFTILDGILVITAVAVAMALWESTIGQSWGQRINWSSFATAAHLGQLYRAWDWTWLWLIPIGLTLTSAAALRKRKLAIPATVAGTLALALIAGAATSSFWIISRAEWVPLWHRRYFIAVLPLLALVAAGAVAAVESSVSHRRYRAWLGITTAMVLVFGLSWQQGTLARLRPHPVALVTRGENWRDAIAWLNANTQPDDLVNLDSGLIEARGLPSVSRGLALPRGQLEYLCFPVAGPYQLDRTVVPVRDVDSLWLPPDRPVVYVMSRQPGHAIARRDWGLGERVIGFRNVSVIVMDRRIDPSLPDD
jgi:mannosyltransferase